LVCYWTTRTENETLWLDLQRIIEGNGESLYVVEKTLILGKYLP
jgi:hypothetical protein